MNAMGLLNSALRFVGFGAEEFAGLGGDGAFAAGTSNVRGAGRLSVANGDSYTSHNVFKASAAAASASAVPGGGGLLILSSAGILSFDLCGILNPFSETKYSPAFENGNETKINIIMQ